MKKLILLLLIAGISYAQSGNPLIDSLSAHRTVLDSLGTQVSNLGLTTGMTMTGDIILEDDVKLKLGDSGADGQLFSDGTESFLQSLSKNLKINATGAYNIYLGTGATYDWQLDADGNFFPTVNQTYDIGDATHEVDSIYVQDLEVSNSIVIGDANITETELEILDGATVTTSELNILDGVTSTASELNALDGITATVTELNYTDGVTSNIQTQLDAKVTTASIGGQIQDSIDADIQVIANFVIPSPQSAEEFPILIGNKEITSIKAGIATTGARTTQLATFYIGIGTASHTAGLNYGTTASTCSTNTATSYTTSILDETFSDGQIDDGQYVAVKIGTVTGTINSLTVTLYGREGD